MIKLNGRLRIFATLFAGCLALLLGACAVSQAPPATSDEVQTTRPASDQDEPTLYWWRDGGIAGFCDGLAIWDAELVAVASCELGDLDRQSARPLPQAQRKQVESWLKEFASFEWEQNDPPQASDRLRITLVFNGQGNTVASQADKEAMLAFVTELFVLMSRNS
jgi:hypothetical protein